MRNPSHTKTGPGRKHSQGHGSYPFHDAQEGPPTVPGLDFDRPSAPVGLSDVERAFWRELVAAPGFWIIVAAIVIGAACLAMIVSPMIADVTLGGAPVGGLTMGMLRRIVTQSSLSDDAPVLIRTRSIDGSMQADAVNDIGTIEAGLRNWRDLVVPGVPNVTPIRALVLSTLEPMATDDKTRQHFGEHHSGR